MADLKGKVIISCAVTGSIHIPSMTDYLPITPEQIADDAVGAAEAGAAVLHLHARDPKTGKPDQSPEAFMRFVPAIRRRTNAILNLTTGGTPYLTIDERIRPALELKPELASLNMGSMNFGLFRIVGKIDKFKHDWERDYLANSRGIIFRNTFEDIERILTTCGKAGTRFEFECYDVGHLYNLAYFVDEGLVQAAVLRSDDLRYSGRYRHAFRRCPAHEANCGPALRCRLPLVGSGRRRRATARCCTGGVARRQRARRSGGFDLGRARQARHLERRSGAHGPPDHRRAGAVDRDA